MEVELGTGIAGRLTGAGGEAPLTSPSSDVASRPGVQPEPLAEPHIRVARPQHPRHERADRG